MSAPANKAGRLARIRELIEAGGMSSQADLAEALAAEGIVVHQATISKDLVELRAVRRRDASGALVYAIEEAVDARASDQAKLARLCGEVLLTAVSSGNLVILKTPPGAAQYFGSAIDKAGWDDIIGTIAGDDTILVVTAEGVAGPVVAEKFLTLSGRR